MRVFLLLVLAAFACALSANSVNDAHYNFRATVPTDFQPWPSDRPRISDSTIHAFYKGDLDDYQTDFLIGFEHLGGTIGRERLDLSKLPPHMRQMNFTVEQIIWNEFEIDMLVLREHKGTDVVTLAAQVPLKPEAIQVNVAGPRSQERQVRRYMRAILDSMEGESNWLTDDERTSRLAVGVGKLIGTIIVVAAVIISIVAFSRNRRKPPPPGYPGGYPPQYPHAPPGPYPQQGLPYPPNPQPPGQPHPPHGPPQYPRR